MTSDFWGRLLVTAFLSGIVGAAIIGVFSMEDENIKLKKSETGQGIGGFILVLSVITGIISAFGYIWTTSGN